MPGPVIEACKRRQNASSPAIKGYRPRKAGPGMAVAQDMVPIYERENMASMPMRFTPRVRGIPAFPGQAGSRRASKANAHVAKVTGGGSPGTQVRQSSLGDLGSSLGGQLGGAVGGETGAAIGEALGGFIARNFGGGDRPSVGSSGFAGPGPCPQGRIRVGSNCISLGDLAPGGAPAVTGAGGVAVMGAFGLPAKQPTVETRIHRSCGPGMVLGRDNLCYPKAILSRRSKYRKHRLPPRPPVSAADMKAIRRAARAKDRVADLGRDVGLHVSKTRGKSRKQIENEIKLQLMDCRD